MPQEYVARWAGARVGAGATVLHFASIAGPTAAQPIANATRTLMEALKSLIPDDVTINYDSEVREISDAGVLLAAYPVTPGAQTQGGSAIAFTNGTGFLVRHSTASIINGRRLLGRTFFVPAANCYNTNGDIVPSAVTQVNTAFAALNTAAAGFGANFSVWSRKNATTRPIVTSVCQVRPTTLRTRNDRV